MCQHRVNTVSLTIVLFRWFFRCCLVWILFAAALAIRFLYPSILTRVRSLMLWWIGERLLWHYTRWAWCWRRILLLSVVAPVLTLCVHGRLLVLWPFVITMWLDILSAARGGLHWLAMMCFAFWSTALLRDRLAVTHLLLDLFIFKFPCALGTSSSFIVTFCRNKNSPSEQISPVKYSQTTDLTVKQNASLLPKYLNRCIQLIRISTTKQYLSLYPHY